MRKAATTQSQPDTGPTAAAFDFTRGNQKFNDASRFFSFMDGYPDTGGISVYVYRTANPTIERDRNGVQVNYVGVHSQKIDLDFMVSEYGSGKFWVVFNDLNKPHSAKNVAELVVEINDLRNPAKFVPEELVVEDNSNRRWLDQLLSAGYIIHETEIERMGPDPVSPGRKKKTKVKVPCLRRPEGLAAPAAPATVVASAPTAHAAPAVDPLLNTLITALLARAQADPFELALKIQNMHPTAAPAAPAALDPMVKTLLEKIIAREVGGGQGGAAGDPFERADTALSFAEKLMKRFGGGPGGDGWGGAARTFVENLPGILTGTAALVASFKTGATPVAIPAAPAAAPAAGNNPLEVDTGDFDVKLIADLQRVGLAAVAAFQAGETGDDFAESLHPGAGPVDGSRGLVHTNNPNDEKAYDFLFAQGFDGIMGFMKMVPGDILAQIQDKAALQKFITDFVNYGKPETETDGPVVQ